MDIKACLKTPLIILLILILNCPTHAEDKIGADTLYIPPKSIQIEAKKAERSTLKKVLWWLPNRFLDFTDIFRLDLGVGSSFGAAVRVTKYGQVAYRSVSPFSVRAGLMGRRAPFMIENSSEMGVGPLFIASNDREVTPLEIGVGADLFLVGAYGGFSVDELADFLGGIFMYDFKEDDL